METKEKKLKMSEFKALKNDEKIKKVIEEVLNKYGFDKETFEKAIDDNDEKIDIKKDDFNKENKITPIGEKKSDKIKRELYE